MIKTTFNRNTKGNVFAMLFAAVAMTGVLGVVGMQTVSGPVTTITKVTQRNIAETDLLTNAKIVVLNGAIIGDPDSDNYVEPAAMRTDATCTRNPTNGGCLPTDIGTVQTDPWGTPYGYCVWDHGNTTGATGMLSGIADTSEPVIAIISAGPDKQFQTSCQNVTAPGVGGVIEFAGSDDMVRIETYSAAVAGAGGLWAIKTGDPTTAVIDKTLEIGDVTGGNGFTFDTASNQGQLPFLRVDTIVPRGPGTVSIDDGQLQAANESLIANGACIAGTVGTLRWQTGGGGSLQVCDGTGFIDVSTAGIEPYRIIDESHGGDTYITVAGAANTDTNAVSVFTNGSERINVSSAGIVNITGDADVGGAFDVTGAATFGGNVDLGNGTDDVTTVAGDLIVDTDKLVVDVSTGFVGINEPSPTSALDVTGSGDISAALTVGTNLTVNGDTTLGDELTDSLTVGGDVAVATDVFVIDATQGFIGINEATPTSALDVTGSGAFSGSLSAASVSTSGTISAGTDLSAGGTIRSGSYVMLEEFANGGACSGHEGAIQYNEGTNLVQYCNGSTWNNIDTILDLGTANLDDLGDVSAASPTTGQTIVWNGTEWVAGTAGTATVADEASQIIDGDDNGDNTWVRTAADNGSNNDTIRMATNGDLRLVIDATGQVGIGNIADPLAALHLASVSYTADSGLAFGDGDTTIYESADDVLTINTAGTQRFTIDEAGHIGIGTMADPGSVLTVLGGDIALREDDDGNDALLLSSDNTTATLTLNDDGTSDIVLSSAAGTQSFFNAGNFVIGGTTADASALLQLESTTQGFLTPRMTEAQRDLIDNDTGTVGQQVAVGLIIFNTDTNTLQVNAGTVAAPSWVDVGAGAAGGDADSAYQLADRPQAPETTSDTLIEVDTAGDGSANTIVFTNDNVESARFDNTGNLGIGTSLPQGMLDVSDLQLNAAASAGDCTNISANHVAVDADGGGTANDCQIIGLVVDNMTGNVGIGTASPSVPLDIQMSANDGLNVRNISGNLRADIGTTASDEGLLRLYDSGGNIDIQLSAQATMDSFINAGDFGIGTDSPEATFDVAGTGAILFPRGVAANRPTGVEGMMRYNSATGRFEAFQDEANDDTPEWLEILTSEALNSAEAATALQLGDRPEAPETTSDTTIEVDTAGDGTANTIVFTNDGNESARFDNSGNFAVGTTTTTIPGANKSFIVSSGATAGTIAAMAIQGNQTTDSVIGTLDFYNDTNLSARILSSRFGADTDANLSFFTTSGGVIQERMRILSSGRVVIGSGISQPSAALEINTTEAGFLAPRMTSAQRLAIASPANGLTVFDTTDDTYYYYDLDDTTWRQMAATGGGGAVDAAFQLGDRPQSPETASDTTIEVDTAGDGSANTIVFTNNDIQSVLIDSGGRVGIGVDSIINSASRLEVRGDQRLAAYNDGAYDNKTDLEFFRAGGTEASPTAVANGSQLGTIRWRGYDGTDDMYTAAIIATINGVVGTDQMPTDLTFHTTSDRVSYLPFTNNRERMRISSSGNIGMGTGAVIDSSAILELSSNNQGFLAPRMTTAQRTAITTPAEGLLIFDTDLDNFFFYDATATDWAEVGGNPTAAGVDTQIQFNTGNAFDASADLTFNDTSNVLNVNGTVDVSQGIILGSITGATIPAYPTLSNDNLGNHTAVQNIKLGSFYLSGDGDDEGIRIDADGDISVGAATADASALVDLTSTAKGFLAPRMTTAQRTAITTPAEGLLVFDTDLDNFFFYDATATDWAEVGGNPTAAGVDTQIQFNTGNAFDASADLTFNDTSNILNVNGTVSAATKVNIGSTTGAAAPSYPTLTAPTIWSQNGDDIYYNQGTYQVGIGTDAPAATLDVVGDVQYTGTLTDVSDQRLKTDIKSFDTDEMIVKISAIDTYSFKMKDGNGDVEFGVMAQELEEIFPELVRIADDEMGTKSVNYIGLIAPMIAATQELKAKNDVMRAEIETLKSQQQQMLQDVRGLKAQTGYGIQPAAMTLPVMLLMMIFGGGIGYVMHRRQINE